MSCVFLRNGECRFSLLLRLDDALLLGLFNVSWFSSIKDIVEDSNMKGEILNEDNKLGNSCRGYSFFVIWSASSFRRQTTPEFFEKLLEFSNFTWI